MAGRKQIWTDKMQSYMVEHLTTKSPAQIAMYFNISVSVVNVKRNEYLKIKGISRSEFLPQRSFEKIEKTKLSFQRPAANYSNRSPYGIASPGLLNP